MNYLKPQLLDELAAQYALGTLRGGARLRFERLCRQQTHALLALHRWEDRFVGLMVDVKPVQPPHAVWQKIQRRLGHERRKERESFWSKLLTKSQLALAASAAAVALTIAVVTYISTTQTRPMATIAAEWQVETAKDHAKLVITRSPGTALDPNRDYELWALPDTAGSAPTSLGLMPKSGKRDLQLSAAQRLALSGASKIAVSLEPVGGSPTGAPTGPVLFVADVIKPG